MLKRHARLLTALTRTADVLISALLFVLLVSHPDMHRDTGLTQPESWRLLSLGLVASLTWPVVLKRLGLYKSQRRNGMAAIIVRVGVAAILSTLLISVTAFLTAAPVARRLPLVFAACQLLLLGALRVPLFGVLRALRRQGRNYRDVLIVGTGQRAVRVQRSIQQHPEWGIRISGFLDEGDVPVDPMLAGSDIRKIVDVGDMLSEKSINELIVACPLSMLPSLNSLVGVCAEAGVPVTLLSDLFGDHLPPPRVSDLGSLAALSFAPVHHDELKIGIKRIIDLVGAGVLLVATAPIIGVAALLIRITSPGPIFYRHLRCGLHGRRFAFLKLRTMEVDADQKKAEFIALNEMDGPVFKIRNDPRITRVGRVLRRWSIDELPQFWNVLRGDMSLVGPRPPLPEEVDHYATFERRRLSMRPGLTCLWQVSGRNEIGFEEWVKLDVQYIDAWSLSLDLEILLRTVPVVLRGTGM